MRHHDVGIGRLELAQPPKPFERALQLAVPAVEHREPVESPDVRGVPTEHGLVGGPGGALVTAPERFFRLGELGREAAAHQRHRHERPDAGRHHAPQSACMA